jgi:hypothetical protein
MCRHFYKALTRTKKCAGSGEAILLAFNASQTPSFNEVMNKVQGIMNTHTEWNYDIRLAAGTYELTSGWTNITAPRKHMTVSVQPETESAIITLKIKDFTTHSMTLTNFSTFYLSGINLSSKKALGSNSALVLYLDNGQLAIQKCNLSGIAFLLK